MIGRAAVACAFCGPTCVQERETTWRAEHASDVEDSLGGAAAKVDNSWTGTRAHHRIFLPAESSNSRL